MKKQEMIDVMVANLPAEEEMSMREALETQSWDELTASFRKWKANRPESSYPTETENTKGKELDDKTAGIQASIDVLIKLKERTVGLNYKCATQRAIKELSKLLQ